ncbi:S-adenosyl-L-methionine-dependent methyltransferase [Massariosphaeria phaeospora]|uniref:S-adenosyl-L-methionine-dependent methyltransferase n=1 Tax=Massariosphaeria phaeospora TaxID=100035 RepID=A0A7C8M2J1_9PLEO|nr:S-adenosyl-L-methionine-dependent methyltransferase [Massariosphaeria phaeospora]
MPDSSSIEARIAKLAADLDSLSVDVAHDEASRKRLMGVVMATKAKVESPIETIWGLIMSPHAPASLMVLIRAGVLAALVAAGKPQTSKALAASTGASEALLIRLMRPLVALGVFRETALHTYAATPISQTLMAPPLLGGYQFMFDLATRALANLPRYLEKTGFAHVDGAPGPFQDCNHTQDGLFAYLEKDPAMMANFNAFMAGSIANRPDWFTTFDVQGIVLAGAKTDAEAVLLVDVAGGQGHDIAAFQHAFPAAPGKLVLQELPAVLDSIPVAALAAQIERQKIDFFEAQPVQGARAYYLRYIFHDWPDAACVHIMTHIAAAMERGYSKLIIFEWILPETDVPLYPALLDVNMMALLNGRERTEEQWSGLLGQAGLQVVRFHKAGADAEGLIEAELADQEMVRP